jgi:NAD-dependent deacetylase sirtuin 3
MLLRVYSQNIDGLEQIAGLGSKKVVYAHGSLQWATCLTCRNKVNASQIEKNVLNGTVAKCQVPFISQGQQQQQQQLSKTKMREPMARARKRQREQEDQGVCGGILKPGVTFFGEALHDNVRRALEADQNKVDALIVIGTSLSVYVRV